jgi:hypothetical protein
MYLGIKRPRVEVGHKSIVIIGYKNYIGRFCKNGKQFIQKYVHHNFVQIMVQDLVKT